MVCVTGGNWLRAAFPLIQHVDRKKRDSRHSSSLSTRMKLWLVELDFHQKRRAEEKPLSPALRMTACCCATDVHYLLVFPLASLLFYAFNILHTGCHERLTLRFNYCFIYNAKLLLVTKKWWTEEVKHALKSVLLIVTCCVFAAICDYWAQEHWDGNLMTM